MLGRGGVDEARVRVTQTVAVHAAGIAVGGEVHIGLPALDGHDRRALDLGGRRLRTGLSQEGLAVHSRHRGIHRKGLGIDHRKQTVIRLHVLAHLDELIGLAAHDQFAVHQRRGTRGGLGELDAARLLELAVLAEREAVHDAVGAHREERGSVVTLHDRGAHGGTHPDAGNLLPRRRIAHHHGARIVADHQMRTGRCRAGPVIAALVLALPTNGTGPEIHAREMTLARATVGGSGVHVPIVDRERAERLLLDHEAALGCIRGQCLGEPHRGERIGRQRLQAATVHRHDDDAPGVHHAGCGVDARRKLRLTYRLAANPILHDQAVGGGHVEVVTHDDGVGHIGHTVGPLGDRAHNIHPGLFDVARGHFCVRGPGARREVRPRALPVGTRRGRRDLDVVLGEHLARPVHVDELDHVAVRHVVRVRVVLRVLAVDPEAPERPRLAGGHRERARAVGGRDGVRHAALLHAVGVAVAPEQAGEDIPCGRALAGLDGHLGERDPLLRMHAPGRLLAQTGHARAHHHALGGVRVVEARGAAHRVIGRDLLPAQGAILGEHRGVDRGVVLGLLVIIAVFLARQAARDLDARVVFGRLEQAQRLGLDDGGRARPEFVPLLARVRQVDGDGRDAHALHLGGCAGPHKAPVAVVTHLLELIQALGHGARIVVGAQERLGIAVLGALHEVELAVDIDRVERLDDEVDGARAGHVLREVLAGLLGQGDLEHGMGIGHTRCRARDVESIAVDRASAVARDDLVFHLVNALEPHGANRRQLNVARHRCRIDGLLGAHVFKRKLGESLVQDLLDRGIGVDRLDRNVKILGDLGGLLALHGLVETRGRRQARMRVLGLLALDDSIGADHLGVARRPGQVGASAQAPTEGEVLARLDGVGRVVRGAALGNDQRRCPELLIDELLQALGHAAHVPADRDQPGPLGGGAPRGDLEHDLNAGAARHVALGVLVVEGHLAVARALGGTDRRPARAGLGGLDAHLGLGEPELIELCLNDLAHVLRLAEDRLGREPVERCLRGLSGPRVQHGAGRRLDLVVSAGRRHHADVRAHVGFGEFQAAARRAGDGLERTGCALGHPPLVCHAARRRHLARRQHGLGDQRRIIGHRPAALDGDGDVRQAQGALGRNRAHHESDRALRGGRLHAQVLAEHGIALGQANRGALPQGLTGRCVLGRQQGPSVGHALLDRVPIRCAVSRGTARYGHGLDRVARMQDGVDITADLGARAMHLHAAQLDGTRLLHGPRHAG